MIDELDKIDERYDGEKELCQFCTREKETQGYVKLKIAEEQLFSDSPETLLATSHLVCGDCVGEIEQLCVDLSWLDSYNRGGPCSYDIPCCLCGDEYDSSVCSQLEFLNSKNSGAPDFEQIAVLCADCTRVVHTFFGQLYASGRGGKE